ncbi:dynamin family protein [Yoonia maritima]|uniref:dynamin family protein n=1 Tax=Yoonia maritima TaxID=1435347 RepID=UPI000D0F7D53|nr:dynamin family protein [Yoonia maritima]
MTNKVSDKATAVLSGWSAQKPGFSLMGEYSAGKSSLLNMLLGQPLLPTKVTATHLPTVWITHGETRKLEVLEHDGTLTELSEDGLDFSTLHAHLAVRFTLPADILREADIVDTPGISDPNLAVDIVELISPHVDFVVWCTAANQAWRQTEKAAWKNVQSYVQRQSILAVTRVDQVGNDKDVQRVMSRCVREAGKSFHSILPISAKLARRDAEDSWTASGAADLVAAISSRVADAAEFRAERAEREGELARNVAVEDDKTEAEALAEKPKQENVQSRIQELVGVMSSAANVTTNDQFLALIDHLKDTFGRDEQTTESHADTINNLLSVSISNDTNLSAAISQVHHEIKDFSEGSWCRLDRVS